MYSCNIGMGVVSTLLGKYSLIFLKVDGFTKGYGTSDSLSFNETALDEVPFRIPEVPN